MAYEMPLGAGIHRISSLLRARGARPVPRAARRLHPRPDEVQIEMGAEIGVGGSLWLVSGEAAGHMKVTVVWKSPDGPTSG